MIVVILQVRCDIPRIGLCKDIYAPSVAMPRRFEEFQYSTSSSGPAPPSSPTFSASLRQHPQAQIQHRPRAGPSDPTQRYYANQPTDSQQLTSTESKHRQEVLPQRIPVVQGIELIPVHDLPDRFRSIFSFPLFNAVQSKCFATVYRSSDNLVISAPTGSGKTAVFELGICRLVNELSIGFFKVVYMAPMKSLCSERKRDWEARLAPLNLRVEEMTGDSDAMSLSAVKNADIIITTPEKWDSMTRKWKDHEKLVHLVKLFLIDEIHILNKDRGATLEAVVSRMKSVGSDIRFIALSATVPNLQDIATWLGRSSTDQNMPAVKERFGEEFRPVKLQKHVCGYQGAGNDFAFDTLMTKK